MPRKIILTSSIITLTLLSIFLLLILVQPGLGYAAGGPGGGGGDGPGGSVDKSIDKGDKGIDKGDKGDKGIDKGDKGIDKGDKGDKGIDKGDKGDKGTKGRKGNNTLTNQQVKAILSLTRTRTIQTLALRNLTRAEIAELTEQEQVAYEIARAEVTGRTVTVTERNINIEACNNGRGGDFNISDPIGDKGKNGDVKGNDDDPGIDAGPGPTQSPVCQYLLANSKSGNLTISIPSTVTLTWFTSENSGNITPAPGLVNSQAGSVQVFVDKDTVFELAVSNSSGSDSCAVQVDLDDSEPPVCTDSDADNYLDPLPCDYSLGGGDDNKRPTVRAEIEALVDVGANSFYSGTNAYVQTGKDIYLRWRGVQSNGQPANKCVGISPDDFAASSNPAYHHKPLGDFDKNFGRATPYSGLADGETRTFTVECSNDYDTDRDSVTLSGSDSLSGVPPAITANGELEREIVRYGDEVDIEWSTNGNIDCTLSNNLTSDPTGSGIETVKMTGESVFTIDCYGGSDSVTVHVVPVVEES